MPGPGNPAMKVVLVFFLGGCTFSEITALRLVGKLQGNNCKTSFSGDGN